MKGFAAAIRFLTIFPVPSGPRPPVAGGALPPTDAGGSSDTMLRWFPVVGLLVGLPVLAILYLGAFIPAGSTSEVAVVLLPAAAALLVWTVVTGGFHEDGWADCADAALAPVEPDRRRDILKDPRIGVHGASALIILLLVRFSALASFAALPPGARELGLILIPPIVGRTAMVVSLWSAKPLNPGGLGATLAAGARPGMASSLALILVGGLGVLLGGEWLVPMAVAVLAGALVGLGLALFLSRRFGGLSGDGHGATGIGSETATLVCLAVMLGGQSLLGGQAP